MAKRPAKFLSPSEVIVSGVPVFLDQLVEALRLELSSNTAIPKTANQHGRDRLRLGFTASQVVHDYGDVCQTITELAIELNEPISTLDFQMMSRCLDEAMAGAVTGYATDRVQLSGPRNSR